MDATSLIRIERLNYMVAGVAIVVSALALDRANALGVTVGATLSCVNFSVLRRMVQGWMRTPPARRGPRGLMVLPKMLGIMLAVILALRFLPISAVGLTIGFSVFLVSIAVESIRYISNPPGDRGSGSSSND